MTQIRWWPLVATCLFALAVGAAPAEDKTASDPATTPAAPKCSCGKDSAACPKCEKLEVHVETSGCCSGKCGSCAGAAKDGCCKETGCCAAAVKAGCAECGKECSCCSKCGGCEGCSKKKVAACPGCDQECASCPKCAAATGCCSSCGTTCCPTKVSEAEELRHVMQKYEAAYKAGNFGEAEKLALMACALDPDNAAARAAAKLARLQRQHSCCGACKAAGCCSGEECDACTPGQPKFKAVFVVPPLPHLMMGAPPMPPACLHDMMSGCPYGCSPMAAMPAPPMDCGPVPPGCRVAPPMPTGQGIMPCSAPTPWAKAEGPCCTLRVEKDGDGCCLGMHCGDTCMSCASMTLKVKGYEPFKVTVTGKQVQLCNCGLKATCDSLSQSEQGDRIVLEGHVQLCYHLGDDQHGELTAPRVALNVVDGQLEIQPAAGKSACPGKSTSPVSLEDLWNLWEAAFQPVGGDYGR